MEVIYEYEQPLPSTSLTGGHERIQILWNEAGEEGLVWSVHRQQRLPLHSSRVATTREETVEYAERVRRSVEAAEAERQDVLSGDVEYRAWLASARKIAPSAPESALREVYETPMSHNQRRQAVADLLQQ